MSPAERSERLARASAARARRDPGVGLVEIWLGIAIWLGAVLVNFVLWLAGVNVNQVSGAFAFPVFAAGLALVNRGRRMRIGLAERALAEDVRAPVLYLRPFASDSTDVTRWYLTSTRLRISPRAGLEKTYEERLARTLRDVGPFVAVGDPTESLPQLGAARVYAPDETWHETVDELSRRAGVVVLQAGEGEGFKWEVRQVVALDAPDRVIISLPLPGKRNRRSPKERYDAFRCNFGDVFPRPLPESIGHCQFVYFDADWTPRLLGERGVALPSGESERTRALGRLAREFKVTWGPAWARTQLYVWTFLGLFAGVGALVSPGN